MPIQPDADGNVLSETLGLELRLRGDELGFYDRYAEKWLETPADAATLRAEQEHARVEQAEAEIARLREEIERLKFDSSGT